MKKLSPLRIAVVLGAAIAGVIAIMIMLFASESAYVRASLPGNIARFEEYREAMPSPVGAMGSSKEGKDYFVVFGPIQGRSVPSGPPAYVFDEKGNLVDWTIDSGEGAFYEEWLAYQTERMSIPEVDAALLGGKMVEQGTGGNAF